MLYNPATAITTPTPRIITGRNLAHGRRSVVERAFLGADPHRDYTQLAEPTIGQAARLVGVCRPYLSAAVAIANNHDARQAVLSGRVPLLGTTKHEETLAEHFARATPKEIAAVVDTIGVSLVWDKMIAPFV